MKARMEEMASTITLFQRVKLNLISHERYYKGIKSQRPENDVLSGHIYELKEGVAFWQDQWNRPLAVLNQQEVVTFHGGKYTDIIREV